MSIPDGPGNAGATSRSNTTPGRWLALTLMVLVAVAVVGCDRISGEAAALQVGECLDLPTDESSFTDVQRQPCNVAHDAEVFMVLVHPAQPEEAFPVISGFDDYVEENCIPAFETYTGRSYPDDELTIGWFHPTLTSWGEGDRGITCHVARIDEAKLTASVRAGAPASP